MSTPKFYRCENLLVAIEKMVSLCGEPKQDDGSGTRARPAEKDWRLCHAYDFDSGCLGPNEFTIERVFRENWSVEEIRSEKVLILNDAVQERRLRARIDRDTKELNAILLKETHDA